MQPDIEAWDAWHPRDFTARMKGADFPWFVVGGWAIDLFLATRTRDYEDPAIVRELSASSFIVAAATSVWRRRVTYGSLQRPRDLTMAGMPLGATSHSVCWGGGRACSE